MPAAIILILAVVSYRVIAAVFLGGNEFATGLSNFSPMAAVVLCAAVFLPTRIAVTAAIGSLLLSDILLNLHYGAGADIAMLLKYAAFFLVFALGIWYRSAKKPALGSLFATTLGCSALFYIVSNTGSWITSAAYSKDLAGLVQALTTGVPGFPPTWMFFRNSLAGDLIFTALFVLCVCPALFRLRPKHGLPRPLPADQ